MQLQLGISIAPTVEGLRASGTSIHADHWPPAFLGQWSHLEVWPESHWTGFALRQADVLQV